MPTVSRAAGTEPLFSMSLADMSTPTLGVALHDGHATRPEVEALLALDRAGRLREEDPFTCAFTAVSPNRVVALRSRFEVDLNRPPESAVYVEPAHAWGMSVWRGPPPPELLARSLEAHSLFYGTLRGVLDEMVRRHGRVLVLDLHTYNHRRAGPDAPPEDPTRNPALNVGTGTMRRERWAPVVDAFIQAVAARRIDGAPVDVRENVRFRGGYFPGWVHRRYPWAACALALEVKKTFMDEWTGVADPRGVQEWRDVLCAGVDAATRALRSEETASAQVDRRPRVASERGRP